jgi:alpha-1,6-mannosyltransferase
LAEKIAYLQRVGGIEHVLVIPGEADGEVREGAAVRYSIRSPLVSRTSRYRMLLRLGQVERILERERPDVIESGDPYQLAWKAVASGEALGIPVVGFYHSHFPEAYLRSTFRFFGATATEYAMDFARRYVRKLYGRFARTLVPSPALGEVLAGWGVPNVVNIDLGVNVAQFAPWPEDAAATRGELGVPEGVCLLLYVGRLAPEKNVRTLFDAFERLSASRPGAFHLLAVGDGTSRGALEELVKKTGAVTWRPYCAAAEELARLYRAADLFVHPGVQETFGLVALEAQACGTPVIGIRGSYMDRIIHNDQTHWAHENTAEALADAIVDAAGTDLAGEGVETSRIVRERYAWDRVFDRLFAVYREVARG